MKSKLEFRLAVTQQFHQLRSYHVLTVAVALAQSVTSTIVSCILTIQGAPQPRRSASSQKRSFPRCATFVMLTAIVDVARFTKTSTKPKSAPLPLFVTSATPMATAVADQSSRTSAKQLLRPFLRLVTSAMSMAIVAAETSTRRSVAQRSVLSILSATSATLTGTAGAVRFSKRNAKRRLQRIQSVKSALLLDALARLDLQSLQPVCSLNH